ncbi:dickkopf-related protein 3-like [Antedon mediterranea]|uniref:dickkopf-related protein 3-like n=1 Tax=Antedon mediterranea TaxID=105859 RepID=UPI003AF8C567
MMTLVRSFGGVLVLCALVINLASAGPNLLRGRRGKFDSDIVNGGLGSSLFDIISKRLDKLLSKLNEVPDDIEDDEWIEFYDDDFPVGNYTINGTSVTKDMGNYTIQTNTSVIIMQLPNGSKSLIMSEEVHNVDADYKCSEDSDCTDDHFCMDGGFYGSECRRCLIEDGMCNRHEQCCADSICYFGQCNSNKVAGDIGATCMENEDCDDNMCCAAMSDSLIKVCKPLARTGELCDSGFQSWLNSILPNSPPTDCPCEDSLVCEDVGFFSSYNVCVKGDRGVKRNSESNIDMDTIDKLRFSP